MRTEDGEERKRERQTVADMLQMAPCPGKREQIDRGSKRWLSVAKVDHVPHADRRGRDERDENSHDRNDLWNGTGVYRRGWTRARTFSVSPNLNPGISALDGCSRADGRHVRRGLDTEQ